MLITPRDVSKRMLKMPLPLGKPLRHGTLEVGKLADFVLLDRDLTRIPGPEIRHVRVLATVVGGEMVFEGGR